MSQVLIDGCTDEAFAAHVAALVARKSEKPKTMSQESSRLWAEVTNHRHAFDWDLRVAEAARKLTKADLLGFYHTYIAAGAPQRRKLSSHIFGKGKDVPKPEAAAGGPGELLISNVFEFKRAQALHPLM